MTPASAWASAAVPFDRIATPRALVAPLPLNEVFTHAERVRSGRGRTVQHWAGRLAAKYAVLRLLDVDGPSSGGRLGEVEILPRPSALCRRASECLHGHPPGVRLRGDLGARVEPGTRVGVSISHGAGLAIAVALASAPLPEDESDDHEDGNA
ncbi:phosphopantetheinyl transferase [Saccharomonospora azurea]|uniref:phosphopantetheinyl transferase n=1 Tax=Saccharomonospora azurea TaxID=40988 RepID=UPI0024094D65|nr:phosphopantetheinyl transferase [Saccharomonospora azurea]